MPMNSMIETLANVQKENTTLKIPDMKFYKELRLGFEIEAIGRDPDYILDKWPSSLECSTGSPDPTDNYWGITHDGSLSDPAVEIQSPVNPKPEDIKKVLVFLRSHGLYINSACGFHIHVSHPDHPIGIKLNKKIRYWEGREEFMASYGSITNINYNYKYLPIRRINDSHLEVRAFNGTLGFRTILGRLDLVKNSIICGKDIIWNIKPTKLHRKIPRQYSEDDEYDDNDNEGLYDDPY